MTATVPLALREARCATTTSPVLPDSYAFWQVFVVILWCSASKTDQNTVLITSNSKQRISARGTVMVSSQKILPEDGKRNVLITSALPYVNNVSCFCRCGRQC